MTAHKSQNQTTSTILNDVLLKIEDGTLTTDDFNKFISEALAKGTSERLHRRTRRSVGPDDVSMVGRVTPKHTADNDPRKGRGARNFRGAEKKKQDKEKQNHPEWFTESIEFLSLNHNKPVSKVSVSNPAFLKRLVARLMHENTEFNKDWLYRLYQQL